MSMFKGLLVVTSLSLTACAGHMTLTKEVQVKASNTIFLTPAKDKTVYVEVRNTTDNPAATLAGLRDRLVEKGYTVADDPDLAHYLLQANIVFHSKVKGAQTIDALIAGGFGGALGAGIASTAVLTRGTSALGWIPGGAALGAVGGFVASRVTEDTTFVLAADTQITERTKQLVEQAITTQSAPGSGVPEQQPGLFGFLNQQSLTAPNTGRTNQTVQEVRRGNERVHQVRFVSSSTRMWNNLAEASQDLSQKLEEGIAAILP